ncbi:MAG: ABC transporter transmembrane domain-containing protein [Elusimicrobiota bacterium]|jgi:subfamily B ATP-binding cassette protein MsbA
MNALRRIWPYLLPYRLRFMQASLAMIVVAATNGISVSILKPLIDDAFNSKNERWLMIIVFAVPAVMAARNIAAYIQNYLMSWIGQSAAQMLRERLFRHLHILSLDFYAEQKSAEILSRVTNDLGNVQSALQFLPLYLIRDTLTIVSLMAVLLYLNWRFALIALLVIPIASAIMGVLGRKMRESSRASQAIMGQIYHRFQESLQGMLLIKAFNYEDGAAEKFRLENASFFHQTMRYLRAAALSGPLMEFFGSVLGAVLIYFSGREILNGRMTTGDFFTFLGAFLAASAPLKNLARLNSELQRGIASAERIFQILDESPSIVESPSAFVWPGLRENLRFEAVSFRYPSRELPALRGVDLEIRRGERVALVGPSGSGKSTLIHLLLRLYDPSSGRIVVDGTDLRELRMRSLREKIGFVTQETLLFNEDVFNNVALGRLDASEEQVRAACRVANADAFIESLPQGYRTPLGDRGLKLSGGQRQRLAIARAVLKDPSLLVLDEATSNLDSTSEREVQAALDRLMAGRTTLVIAHRLSTIKNADRIYVLQDGAVAECGSHAQLLARDGLYRRLYEIQSSEPAAAEAS